MDLFPQEYKYILDTSAFVELRRSYPPEVFPSVWTKMEHLCESDTIRSTEEVLHELNQQEDLITEWAKKFRHIFLSLDEDIQLRTGEVLSTHANLLDLRMGKSGADPFVIGTALVHKSIVVSQENPSGGPNRSKIPDVCSHYKIKCIKVLAMLREEGLRL